MGPPPSCAIVPLLALAIALLNAEDLAFSGRLDFVAKRSLALRLEDGRVIDALLPSAPLAGAEALAAGDTVRMQCKKIRPSWDADASRYHFLEVTGIELVRHGAPERPEHFAALEGAADPTLERARDVNLRYASQLPNYVADETATRYTRDSDAHHWRHFDNIGDEITVRGAQAARQRIRRNGRPTHNAFERLPGFKWTGGFGTEIRPIFDPHCPTHIERREDSRAEVGPWVEYRFTSRAHACFVPFYFEYERYNPARSGQIFLDTQGRLVRLVEVAGEFPSEFEFKARTEEVFWDDVKIAGASHLVPVKARFVVVYSSGVQWRVEVAYTNYRHFEASTTIIPLQ